ncbi:RNA polymerase sigma factor [Alloiococcus sp. CFN-8]|uniref:RNA polymerase sigma factor n=1 Tax=Alloiococcus sp. CFN-8 TaxID=3416081 RepID=UPI003CE6E568
MELELKVKEAQRGNEEAFLELIKEHKVLLFKTLHYYLKNQESALEGVQEVTCRALINIKNLKNPQGFKGWLMKIAVNYAFDEIKKNNREGVAASEPVSLDFTTDNNYQRKADEISVDKIYLDSLLGSIKPEYSRVIGLKYFQDMTISDISKALGMPEGTVKSYIRRGLKAMRAISLEGGICNEGR